MKKNNFNFNLIELKFNLHNPGASFAYCWRMSVWLVERRQMAPKCFFFLFSQRSKDGGQWSVSISYLDAAAAPWSFGWFAYSSHGVLLLRPSVERTPFESSGRLHDADRWAHLHIGRRFSPIIRLRPFIAPPSGVRWKLTEGEALREKLSNRIARLGRSAVDQLRPGRSSLNLVRSLS